MIQKIFISVVLNSDYIVRNYVYCYVMIPDEKQLGVEDQL